MKIGLLSAFAALVLVFAAPLHAQAAAPLFASDAPIRIAIQAQIANLGRHRASGEAIPGTLTDPGGQVLPITLALRGITRRTAEICDFPPLRVQFTTPPPATSVFAGQKQLKLVTHCRNAASFQQYVLLEFAAYRMYDMLTPKSFRVRLATIDYRDPSGRPIVSRVGYFIEPLGDVAKRNGTISTRAQQTIPLAALSPIDAARYALFQHMIANHDWSMRAGPAGKQCCHNAELIGPLAAGSVVPIPYDFDFSGFVDPSYATPPDVLNISSVRERVYRGYCVHNAEALAAARQMRNSRPQLLAALASTPGLEPATQARAIKFLDGFFAQIASDDAVNSRLLSRCAQ
jgi:hypothetical protein